MIFANKEQLIQITGEVQKSKQIRRLKAKRIKFYINRTGHPVIVNTHFDLSLAKRLFASAKSGAKARDLSFTLVIEDVVTMIENSNWKCSLTGIPFSFEKENHWRKAPWSPSIDRIDGERGYSKDNCRLICLAANIAINEWGIDVLKTIGTALISGSDLGTNPNLLGELVGRGGLEPPTR